MCILAGIKALHLYLYQIDRSVVKKKAFFELGGMPSSHSAFVSALSTSVGLTEDFSSTIFLVTLGFSALIIHDAVHIRKHHKAKEVFIGVLIGIIITLIVKQFLF